MNSYDHIAALRHALTRIREKAQAGACLDMDQLSALEDIDDISGDALDLYALKDGEPDQ